MEARLRGFVRNLTDRIHAYQPGYQPMPGGAPGRSRRVVIEPGGARTVHYAVQQAQDGQPPAPRLRTRRANLGPLNPRSNGAQERGPEAGIVRTHGAPLRWDSVQLQTPVAVGLPDRDGHLRAGCHAHVIARDGDYVTLYFEGLPPGDIGLNPAKLARLSRPDGTGDGYTYTHTIGRLLGVAGAGRIRIWERARRPQVRLDEISPARLPAHVGHHVLLREQPGRHEGPPRWKAVRIAGHTALDGGIQTHWVHAGLGAEVARLAGAPDEPRVPTFHELPRTGDSFPETGLRLFDGKHRTLGDESAS